MTCSCNSRVHLATLEKKLETKVPPEYFIQWKNLPLEDATWAGPKTQQHQALQLLSGEAIQ